MNKLYDLRKKHNLSQTELGEVFGISQSVINRMELGTRPIRGNELKMFADFFGVTTDYLLGNDAAPLPAGESRLLELFRALPDSGKQALLSIAAQMRTA